MFAWGYGNDGQLANNENKGRYAFSVLVLYNYMTYINKDMYAQDFTLFVYTPTELTLLNR